MKRTFYFIRDSVSGKFYTGQGNHLSTFSDAAVYFQEKNASKKIKDIIRSWKHDEKFDYEWYKENYKHYPKDIYDDYLKSAELSLIQVAKRKSLENWGMEIVQKEITIN